MKSNLFSLSVILLVLSALMSGLSAQDKLAQSGFQFLSVGQDARAAGMGEAFTTVEGTPNALFYNPAGIASINNLVDIRANYFEFIADIKYTSFTIASSPWGEQYGVFGLSIQAVNYGEVQGTMVWANPDGYVDTEILEPSTMAIGLGYGKALSDRFVVGGQIRYVAQSLGKSVIPGEGTKRNVADVLSFDFGTIYRTGFKSLAFGMSVRNFSQEIKYEQESFQLPLTFKIGVSIDALDFADMNPENHSLLVVFDAAHPRSYPEYINLGLEYMFQQSIALRFGYISNQNEYDFTLGFGLQQFGFKIDYAYQDFGVFSSLHRFSLGFTY